MQQKRKISVLGTAVTIVAIVLVGGMAVLMSANPPASQHPIEKQLDAAAFLGQKQ